MGKLVGVVGKPNAGKSTFFNANTLGKAETGSYPFTTIKPNRGVGYIRADCPCTELGNSCGKCKKGTRFIPIELFDVAGLVPDAHKGRGLGNQFLNDLAQADAFIHVVDASGSTDVEGQICEAGSHNPEEDVTFLEKELDLWFLSLIEKGWGKITREATHSKKEVHKELADKFSGIKVKEGEILGAARKAELDLEKAKDWPEEDLKKFATALREVSMPILICANKIDLETAKPLENSVPTSADYELALRKADESEIIDYKPGDSDFKILEASDEHMKVLEIIKRDVLEKYGSTGVQQCLEKVVSETLNLIPVYPVEDESKLTDKKGNVLPDVHLVPAGTTAKDFAYLIHTDIGDAFLCGIDARTKKKVGADYELKAGDVIKIVVKK